MIFRSNIEKEYESEELVDILSDDESVVELDNDRDEKYEQDLDLDLDLEDKDQIKTYFILFRSFCQNDPIKRCVAVL